MLNRFHPDIKFTYETEVNNDITFLDAKVTKKGDGTFITDVYRKKSDSSIYMNWDSFATRTWKIGTLKGLFRRAFMICSTEETLSREIKYLKHVFTKINGYPSRAVNKTLYDVRSKWNRETTLDNVTNIANVVTDPMVNNVKLVGNPYICLPYKGYEGENIVKRFRKGLNDILPSNIKPRFIYKGTKLGSFFKVKNKIDVTHETDLIYGYTPSGGTELKNGYIGETNVRFGRRAQEHATWDKASSVFKFAQRKNVSVSFSDFEVLEKGFPKNLDRKIAEALYVKEFSPILNEQKESFKLKLFN